ncbi:uncharacterized protein K452DRAFT_290055 [Aplosporella prunicola CBS 121167]|uniref:Uncharacterized protein n=1 Tax=Aplosporella prunicola CBS 121167 TaxID=1176127 RepID=A0A6A6B4H3_9PEZI|nr:uncharacterized protein K452DRAFT_290055 [Aplosporella prunicola CBS 121167]KAF2138950.1 hypothetical protein K452DRAFT_290055 [Aplosporella prunicola CBS 121167]
MRAAAILSVLGGLIGSTSAIISGIAVPSEIWPGQTIRVTIITSNYIQTVQDVAISFGISPQNNYHEGWLGQFLSSKFLGPDDSNIIENRSHVITIPESQPIGPAVIGATLFSLYGVSTGGVLTQFTANTTIVPLEA